MYSIKQRTLLALKRWALHLNVRFGVVAWVRSYVCAVHLSEYLQHGLFIHSTTMKTIRRKK